MYYFLSVIVCLTVMMSPAVGKAQQAVLFGVNLAAAEFGNTLPGSYGRDHTYPTAEELDYYKRKNLKLIRLPFAWERIQPTLNFPLDAAEVSHMTDFLNAADAKGMHVILDASIWARHVQRYYKSWECHWIERRAGSGICGFLLQNGRAVPRSSVAGGIRPHE